MHRSHADKVLASVSSSRAAARSPVAASWRRCFAQHRLDPAGRVRGREIDGTRLHERSDALGRLLHVAEPRLDDLFQMMGHCGRGIFLTDRDGLILAGRTRAGDAVEFRGWGLEPGTDWSEAAQGTNGIGTCLAEGRAVTIHRDQHYLAQNTAMSCIDAPVYGPQGDLIAALDVSSARMDDTEGFNQLIAAMVVKLSQQIETDLFRDAYAGNRIVMASEDGAGCALLAVGRDDIVVGATRRARQMHQLERNGTFVARPLSDLMGEQSLGLEGAERAAVIRAITRAGGNMSQAARALGVGRATLYRRMKRLGLEETGPDLSRN